jgi:sugar (pentulose or hexulose) kinase
MRDIIQALQSGLDIHPEKIVAVGGAIKNHFWMQNKADVLGIPVEVPDLYEATPLGAAILAGIGVGTYSNEADAYRHICNPGKVYTPNETLVPKYDRAYGIYKQLYPAMKDINTQLYDAAISV